MNKTKIEWAKNPDGKCCPPDFPEGYLCRRCKDTGTILLDTFKDMGLNRAERRRRLKDDSQRYKYIPCPECKGAKDAKMV